MCPALTLVALALASVDLGYQPSSDGGVEFIAQINSSTLQACRSGDHFDFDVPTEVRNYRPSHISVTLGDGNLPHTLPVAASLPATATQAGSVGPSIRGGTSPLAGGPELAPLGTGDAPVRIGPPTLTPAKPVTAHGWPLLTPNRPQTASANSAGAKLGALAPLNGDSKAPVAIDHPWLGMSLLLIALVASNTYVGWLFWDARQRYRDLLARNFSFGQRTVEAAS